ncbi:MAG TPA: Uma2 family endonuclease [Candidatus Binatia bacterium]|nr:Uma2 family endonuclease [Candidatus Binatia bacterium]
MKSGAVRVAETAFISTETFTQKGFKDWVENRPIGDINRYELASGRILMTPPAAWEHAKIEAKAIRLLEDFVSKHNLGTVFGSSAGYELPSGDTLEPDASFISRERWSKGPQPRRGQFLKIVPTLTVEIISPATARRDRIEKKRIYEANGVDEYWLVDPHRREVTIFHLTRGKYDDGNCFEARQKLRSEVLVGLEVPARLLLA